MFLQAEFRLFDLLSFSANSFITEFLLISTLVETAFTLDYFFQLFPCLLKDTTVDKHHDHKRDVEGDNRRDNSIASVGMKLTAKGVVHAVHGLFCAGSPPLQMDG